MKKSIIKKLSLSKESIANLDTDALNQARGGKVTVTMDCAPTWDTCAVYC